LLLTTIYPKRRPYLPVPLEPVVKFLILYLLYQGFRLTDQGDSQKLAIYCDVQNIWFLR